MNAILPIARHLLAASLLMLTTPMVVLADGGDNFNDNSKNTTNWGADVVSGNGVLSESGQHLQFTCNSTTGDDESTWPWNASRFPYNADWEVQIDCFNNTSPVAPLQVNSMGITLESPLSGDTFLYHELYNSNLGIGGTARTGFNADMTVNDVSLGGGDSSGLGITTGAIRLRWTASTEILAVYYDANPSNGYQWVEMGTFGLGGSGGHTRKWGLGYGRHGSLLHLRLRLLRCHERIRRPDVDG